MRPPAVLRSTSGQCRGDPDLIPRRPEGWLALEDGVEIQFVDPQNSVYRTGDYWLIPARVATGDVEWPRESVPGIPRSGRLPSFPTA